MFGGKILKQKIRSFFILYPAYRRYWISQRVRIRGQQWNFWWRARRPGLRLLGMCLWCRPRSTGVHSASLHPSSVCPSRFDNILHVGCLTFSCKRALKGVLLSIFGIIKSKFIPFILKQTHGHFPCNTLHPWGKIKETEN